MLKSPFLASKKVDSGDAPFLTTERTFSVAEDTLVFLLLWLQDLLSHHLHLYE